MGREVRKGLLEELTIKTETWKGRMSSPLNKPGEELVHRRMVVRMK